MLRGRKLLLADDSIAIQKVIELTFVDEGMQVVSVADGQQAVERLEAERPDIVLADVFMPKLGGYEVCDQIKRDERFRHIPVILLVGSFEPFNEAEARRVGADDYLTKPFQSIRQMVSKVGSLLSGHKNEPEAATQKLPTQPDAMAEGQDRRDNLELTTADTAPLPQHMRYDESDENNAPPKGPFTDLQLDDEMIEETPASEYGSAGQAAAAAAPQQRQTEPVSAQDLAEMGVTTAAATSGTSGQSFAASGSSAEARETAGSTPTPSATPTLHTMRAATDEDALLDLDDVEMPRTSAMSEADDFILDLQDSAEAQPQTAPPVEAASSMFDSAPQPAGADESVIEAEWTEGMTEAAPQAAEFVEAQVMGDEQQAAFAPAEEQQQAASSEFNFYQQGAPPAEIQPETPVPADTSQMRSTHELSTEPQPAPTGELRESFWKEAAPVESEAASDAPAAVAQAGESAQQPAAQINAEQLSPEVIDAIARRVVEQLSTKVIEQIAWEVVPQLSELIIKRRLEEGKQ